MLRSTMLILLVLANINPNIVQASPYKFDKKREMALFSITSGLGLLGWWRDSEKDDPTIADLNNLDRQDLWGIDRRYAGRWDGDAHQASNAVLTVALLSPSLHFFKQTKDIGQISLLYLETQLAILSGISLSKGIVSRYRPFTYGTEAPLEERLDADATRSFFSGHSATITGGLVFTAKVFSDYYPSSAYKPWVWAGALSLATYGSWQRVEAGRHFPTDVATGMVWGATMGYLIPQWHKSSTTKIGQWLPYYQNAYTGLMWHKEF